MARSLYSDMKLNRIRLLCVGGLLLMLGTQSFAQTTPELVFDATRLFAAEETYGTPVHEDNDGKKHYLTAITGALLPQALFMAWCRWVYGATWAQVNWDDVRTFYKRELEWDTDWVWTNFILHPFQGSLYYMAARNSNLNRIESLAVTAVADAIWEWFYETTDPSVNDLGYSFLGGFAVGEMMYRLSLEAEQVHALLGYVVNPERLWTDVWLRQHPRGTVGNIYEFALRFSVGTSHAYTSFDSGAQHATERFPFYFSPECLIIYNDPYGHDSNNPYSQFELRFGGGIGPGTGIWRGNYALEKHVMYDVFLFSNGMLLSRAPEWGENRDTTVGFVFDYDFRWQSLIDLSTISPGVAIKQRIRYEHSRIEWQLHTDVMLIGMTDYYYAHRDPNMDMAGLDHDYSYMFGSELVFCWNWINDKQWLIENTLHAYIGRDFTWQAQDGQSTGWEFIGLYDLTAEVPLSQLVRLGVSNKLYLKRALYDDIGNVFQVMYSGGVYAKLQFK